MAFIHAYDRTFPSDEDYRVNKQTQFLNKTGLQFISLDLSLQIDNADKFNDLVRRISAENLMHKENVYLAISCLQIQLCRQFISRLCDSLASLIKDDKSEQNIEIILLEDLFFVERAYIYSGTHSKFLTYFEKTVNQHVPSYFTGRISSTNEELNRFGEGDVFIVKIPQIQNDPFFFTSLLDQVPFQPMFNQGNAVPRLVSEQHIDQPMLGTPIYRHPHDNSPAQISMQPIVLSVLSLVYAHLPSVQDKINHVLIQHYRDGSDNIASHSDKTLDIDLSTPIINLSIGSTRYMYIQHKQHKANIQKIPLKHGEMVVFGLQTNRYWYHEVPKLLPIPHDEMFGTSRISLTFRAIQSYYNAVFDVVIGQGSPFKTLEEYTQSQDAGHDVPQRSKEELIASFSKENKQSEDFNWSECYGQGFLLK